MVHCKNKVGQNSMKVSFLLSPKKRVRLTKKTDQMLIGQNRTEHREREHSKKTELGLGFGIGNTQRKST
jgi:hypothetical protein